MKIAVLKEKFQIKKQYRTVVTLLKDAAYEGKKSIYLNGMHPEVIKKLQKEGFEVHNETISWVNPKKFQVKILKLISMYNQYKEIEHTVEYMSKSGNKYTFIEFDMYSEVAKKFEKEGYSIITEDNDTKLSWEFAK